MRLTLSSSCAWNVDANAERALDLWATANTATDPLWETTRTKHVLLRMTFANKNREMKLEVKIAIITTSKIITNVTFILIIIIAIIIVIISITQKGRNLRRMERETKHRTQLWFVIILPQLAYLPYFRWLWLQSLQPLLELFLLKNLPCR